MGATNDQPSLLREIQDLKRRVRQLENEKRVANTSVGQGGSLKFINPETGDPLIYIGSLENTGGVVPPKPDGTPQYGTLIFRDTGGTAAFGMYDPNPDDGYGQFAAFWDQSGRIAMSDDAASGFGLAEPWIPTARFHNPNADIPSTTATSFTDRAAKLLMTVTRVTHPYLEVSAAFFGDTSGTAAGDGRLVINDAQAGDTFTFAHAGGSTNWLIPIDQSLHKTFITVELQARRTSGTGAVFGFVWYAYHRQT